jgi:hypothetical protein
MCFTELKQIPTMTDRREKFRAKNFPFMRCIKNPVFALKTERYRLVRWALDRFIGEGPHGIRS